VIGMPVVWERVGAQIDARKESLGTAAAVRQVSRRSDGWTLRAEKRGMSCR
jgi:hypothetical protein